MIPLQWLVIVLFSIYAFSPRIEAGCNIYLPKAVRSGLLTNPSYPYPEYTHIDCQYVFDLYTPKPQLTSMLCVTFERFHFPSQYENACSSNYLQFGITRGAIICGGMTNLTVQYLGGSGTDESEESYVKIKWPTVCYSDSHLLEVMFRIGWSVNGDSNAQSFYATYQQFMFPSNLDCPVPAHCISCSSLDTINTTSDRCPVCICASKYTAVDPVADFGCNFTKSVCSLVPDRYNRWRSVQASGHYIRRGPSNDHTYGNFFSNPYAGYMYLAEFYMSQKEEATLTLKIVQLTQTHCMQFWYYMSGSHVGRLDLVMNGVVVWYREGDQGSGWWLAQITIAPKFDNVMRVYTNLAMAFRGTALFQSPDFGGISVDDISLIPGKCPTQRDFSCTFETDFCGWIPRGDIMVASGGVADHTENHRNRQMLVVSASYNRAANLTSPYVTDDVTAWRCLSFWHKAYSALGMVVNVYVRWDDFSGPSRTHVKGFSAISAAWQREMITISRYVLKSSAYQIELVFMGFDHSNNARILVDDIQLSEGKCPDRPTSAPPTAMPVCGVEGTRRCPGSHTCILENQICDGRRDCPDNWDENQKCSCPLGMFRCLRGDCIKSEYRCDHIIHCSDGSDEASSYANCESGPVLSVGAIIGSSFGVMCLCVLLVTLCAWACIYAKNRRVARSSVPERRFTPRRPRALPDEPYMIDCPEAPPHYFSINWGFENTPSEPPPSYESVIASEHEPAPPTGRRLSLSSIRLPSFRELFRMGSQTSISRTNRTDSYRTTDRTMSGRSQLSDHDNFDTTTTANDVDNANRAAVPPVVSRPPMSLSAHLLAQQSVPKHADPEPEPDDVEPEVVTRRQPSWRAAVAQRLSEVGDRLPPPDIVSGVHDLQITTGTTYV